MISSYRAATEEIEMRVLGKRAQFAALSRGRAVPEPEDDLRTSFQRDRDRIVHAKSFRRLAHKTQVFLAPEGDHYRVRLTHTLEVAQVARTIARALRLNEDLVEAICLGHDLGHTPFGHLGEEVVAGWSPGFRHNLQSVRVAQVLEGLNLTWEVQDGIANHTWTMPMPATLEGQITRYADRIAYLNHDIDDAVRAGILEEKDLPEETLDVLGRSHSERIRKMITDLVRESAEGEQIGMSADVFAAMGTTRTFLFDALYVGRVSATTKDSVQLIVATLLDHYASTPIPAGAASPQGHDDLGDDASSQESAVDYVAGMTDRFAIRTFEAIVGGPAPPVGS